MAGHIADSTSVHWNTPAHIVEAVRNTFGFIHLDPCSNKDSIVDARKEIILPKDGLKLDWDKYANVYCNPPYGRDKERGTSIYDWVKKAAECKKAEVIMIIPAAVDTKHWQQFIFPRAGSICFLRGRVKFSLKDKKPNSSTVPTAAVYFGENGRIFEHAFEHLGAICYTTT